MGGQIAIFDRYRGQGVHSRWDDEHEHHPHAIGQSADMENKCNIGRCVDEMHLAVLVVNLMRISNRKEYGETFMLTRMNE